MSTHLLVSDVSELEVRQALAKGRAYVAFDWIADPTGFVYCAQRGAENWPMGSEVTFGEDLYLRAEAPLDAHFKLVRDGEIVLEETGPATRFQVDKPGIYRVEAWLNLAGEDRPWILTNPIYVRGKE